MLQEVETFQGPRVGSCLTLGNELSKETHVLTKQKTLLERGIGAESNMIREARSPAQSPSSGFMVNGDCRLSLASYLASCLAQYWSDSGSYLVASIYLSQDGF